MLGLSNNTSIVSTLSAGYNRFMSLYRVRAHAHHYTQYMDSSLFHDALTNMMDVISAYNEGKPQCTSSACTCFCWHMPRPLACSFAAARAVQWMRSKMRMMRMLSEHRDAAQMHKTPDFAATPAPTLLQVHCS